jgi:hypothetical protein
MRQHAFMHGPQMEGGAANPVGQRRTVEIDSLAGVDLRLPVERQMIGVFGDEDLRHGRLGWNAALDQSRRRGRLNHDFLAGATGVFGTARHQHAESRGQNVEAFGDVLADDVQPPLAARACLVLDVDDHLDARQVRRQRAAIHATLPGHLFAVGWGLVFALGRRARLALLHVFEREQHLGPPSIATNARQPSTIETRQEATYLRRKAVQTTGASSITSQVPVDRWHDMIGIPTLADAILDRIVHNAYRVDLSGESLRKRGSPSKSSPSK